MASVSSTWTSAPPLFTEIDDRDVYRERVTLESAGQRVGDGASARELGLDEAPLELLDGGGGANGGANAAGNAVPVGRGLRSVSARFLWRRERDSNPRSACTDT